MSKHPSEYTSADVYELEAQLLKLAADLGGEQGALIREGAGVLLNQTVRLAQVGLCLRVRG